MNEKEDLDKKLFQLSKENNIYRINSYEGLYDPKEAIEIIEKYKDVLRECSLPEKYYEKLVFLDEKMDSFDEKPAKFDKNR